VAPVSGHGVVLILLCDSLSSTILFVSEITSHQ